MPNLPITFLSTSKDGFILNSIKSEISYTLRATTTLVKNPI